MWVQESKIVTAVLAEIVSSEKKKTANIRITFLMISAPVTMRVDGDGLFETSQTSSRPSHIVMLNNL